ncbi:hypothetical protein [Bacterioplanoides sp.]|uniref:hypothetical protein n=1 Tax=Bacterioplanoides sp. TaxID=2066072 RepID=UPI003B5BD7BD
MKLFSEPKRTLVVSSERMPGAILSSLYSAAMMPEPFIPNCIFLHSSYCQNETVRNAKSLPHWNPLCTQLGLNTNNIMFEYIDCKNPDIWVADFLKEQCRNPANHLLWVVDKSYERILPELSQLFSIFSSPGDSLCRLIIDKKYDNHKEFYYPGQRDPLSVDRQRQFSSASVKLENIPFIRLNAATMASGKITNDILSQTGKLLSPQILTIYPDRQNIQVGPHIIKMSPLLFAFYFWMVRLRKRSGNTFTPDAGFISYDDQGRSTEFLNIYRQYCDELSSHYEKTENALASGFPKDYFFEKVSLIKRTFNEVLGDIADAYVIHSIGKRHHTRYGIHLPPHLIQFISGDPDV